MLDFLMVELVALLALTAMEIVLGVDNIVFISVVSAKLPREQQAKARWIGLLAAMGCRLLLLLGITWIIGLTHPAFTLTGIGIPESWFSGVEGHAREEMTNVSWKDIILLLGGLFLIRSSVIEIHHKMEGAHPSASDLKKITFGQVIFQIVLLDIIFSIDSVITAVGMVKSIWVMMTAVVIAVGVMMIFAERISGFVEKHPTVKMLALSFLLLIGVMLVAEGAGTHIDKGYIYFAMAFALGVEVLNLRMKAAAARKLAAAEKAH